MSTNNTHKNTGQSNKRKQPPSPKTNERYSNHLTNQRSTHHHHYHRNRPRSSSLPSQDQQQTSRRPSAPPLSPHTTSKQPLPLSEPPRLSIADRFMSPKFSLYNTTSPSTSTSTALSHSALSHSALSDDQTTSSSNRLSVADRFMNSPTTSSLMISTSRGKDPINHRHSSPIDPVPGKLSIANTFMRHTSDGSFLSPISRSVGDTDLGVSTKITPSSSSTSTVTGASRVHPLDLSQKSSLFGSDHLDLSLPTTFERRHYGSQDTLVQKKLNNARHSFLMDDYYPSDSPERRDTAITIVASEQEKYKDDRVSEKWQYDDMYDEESDVQNELPKRHDYNKEEEQPNGFWIGCCFISCGRPPTHLNKKQKKKSNKKSMDKEDESNRRCGRRGWVFFIFLIVIFLAFIIYFLWPRTPLIRIEGAKLITPPKITETQQSHMMSNVAFESEWLVNVTVDNRQNHVPTRLTRIQVLAKDALTGLVIGKGNPDTDSAVVLSPNVISTIQLPIIVDYQARDSTDTTFVDLTKSCSARNSTEALPLHFWITLHFFGLDWLGYKPTVIATPATGGFACPVS